MFHNEHGSPRVAPDKERFERVLRDLKHPPLVLSQIARKLVDAIMRKHCQIRKWDLRTIKVRSNHVHVVIADPLVEPEMMVQQLRDWGTRTLRAHRIIGVKQRAWAHHGSTIYLFEPGSLEKAIKYVSEMQDGNVGREDWDVKLGLRERRSASSEGRRDT
jgi:hypothetical protein